eukprot:Nk52_evm19s2011 gene=Nk52_evmTU19s2011
MAKQGNGPVDPDYIEIIKDRLYFACQKTTPKTHPDVHYFSTDTEYTYQSFYDDFGPLNLGMLYRYCRMIEKKLIMPNLHRKILVHYCKGNARARTNAIFLIASYAVLYLDWSPDKMYKEFIKLQLPLVPFRDASFGPSIYNLGMIDVLKGLLKAKSCGFLNFNNFSLDEYQYYERVENGDFNWIIPGQFLAFSGPHGTRSYANGYSLFTPEDYIPYFKSNGIKAVIRLNKKMYDKRQFTSHGIKHYDMFFVDGSNPTQAIVENFLQVCQHELLDLGGAVAVHCKAGLGRTGTLLGCYMMKHFKFTAPEAIAWLRVCRPGSVIGPQQLFLEEQQAKMWRAGESMQTRSVSVSTRTKQEMVSLQSSLSSTKKKSQESKDLVRPKSVKFSGSVRTAAESEEMLTDSLQGVKIIAPRGHHHIALTRSATSSGLMTTKSSSNASSDHSMNDINLSNRPTSQGAGLLARKSRNLTSASNAPSQCNFNARSVDDGRDSFLKGAVNHRNLPIHGSSATLTRTGSVVENRLNATIGCVSGVRMTRASTLRAKSAHSRGRNAISSSDSLSIVGRSGGRK